MDSIVVDDPRHYQCHIRNLADREARDHCAWNNLVTYVLQQPLSPTAFFDEASPVTPTPSVFANGEFADEHIFYQGDDEDFGDAWQPEITNSQLDFYFAPTPQMPAAEDLKESEEMVVDQGTVRAVADPDECYCTGCGIAMGPMNPRQYCCKTHCPAMVLPNGNLESPPLTPKRGKKKKQVVHAGEQCVFVSFFKQRKIERTTFL